MNKQVQAKHIDDREVLALIDALRMSPWPGDVGPREDPRWVLTPEIERALPAYPWKVVLAKLRALEKRRLISGCLCGCRGDLELTVDGEAFLRHPG